MKIFECVHGSRLFGTNIEGSDTDLKSVFICLDLTTYMAKRAKFKTLTPTNGLEGAEKEEHESYYIQDFEQHLRSMQTNCVSMVWAPRDKWLISTPAWEELVENRHRLHCKNMASYAGYCKGQAVKYTLKGERLSTTEDFLKYIQDWEAQGMFKDNNGKMTDKQWAVLTATFVGREGCDLWVNTTGEHLIRVVGKSFSKTTRVEGWIEPMAALLRTYGRRSKKSKEDGQDLKALLHAFRIAHEAKELLETGALVYPTPRRQFYLDIRANKFSYEELQEGMTEELEDLNQKIEASTLPDDPDIEFLRSWGIRWQQHYWGIS
jgi:hypothetical protein